MPERSCIELLTPTEGSCIELLTPTRKLGSNKLGVSPSISVNPFAAIGSSGVSAAMRELQAWMQAPHTAAARRTSGIDMQRPPFCRRILMRHASQQGTRECVLFKLYGFSQYPSAQCCASGYPLTRIKVQWWSKGGMQHRLAVARSLDLGLAFDRVRRVKVHRPVLPNPFTVALCVYRAASPGL